MQFSGQGQKRFLYLRMLKVLYMLKVSLLIVKEGKWLRGGDPLILCFVDFTNPSCAATAIST
ncbi:hypothetical protein AHAS_Ahas13G0427300 [Arachis hypogaea]